MEQNSPDIKVSIITVCLNAEKEIVVTEQSIYQQDFPWYEWVVVDGLSSDRTLEIAKASKISRKIIVSEKDKGLYDAMNKGIKLASGEYLMFLNAGDTLYDTHTLSEVFRGCSGADVIYGETLIRDAISGRDLGRRRLKAPEHLTYRHLLWGMMVSHQSVLVRRLLVPEYDIRYRYSADIDWLIRILKQTDRVCNVHRYVSCFTTGGMSGRYVLPSLKERFVIQKKHFGFFPVLLAHLFMAVRFPVQYALYRRKV